MSEPVYPSPSKDLARKRRELGPNTQAAFDAFSQAVFADGAMVFRAKSLGTCSRWESSLLLNRRAGTPE